MKLSTYDQNIFAYFIYFIINGRDDGGNDKNDSTRINHKFFLKIKH